ncbi:AraC family transcriptional regulator [Acinetobacter beijerinckii]|uniref:AraC family transcriptional regulator n=1 Tax=Acinetobacter beijerinckii TaxID=262668 RepID=UPI0005EFA870|nr:AraC family transcriptional regulator [Acinetobacter beijerinckii]
MSSVYVRALLDYLINIGIDPKNLFDNDLISAIHAQDRRISIPDWQRMFEKSIAFTNDSNLPLKVAEIQEPRYLGMLGFAAMSSRTLGDAISILVRFEQLVDDVNSVHLVEKNHLIELHWIPLSASSPIFMQLSLACWIILARILTKQPTLECEAHFSFKKPLNLEAYYRIFGDAVSFEAESTKLVFDKSWLNLPITLFDSVTNHLLIGQAEEMLRTKNQPDFLKDLNRYLSANLATNQVTISEAANALNLTPRTLQFKLHELGLGYRTLLEKIRHEHAERYLKHTDLTLNEISFLLGYLEQSSFQNAFKRWTGKSPGSFRKSFEIFKQ